MTRKFTETTLGLATHNAGKVHEITKMLEGAVPSFKSATELELPEPDETGTTFAENAILKARAGAKHSGIPCLADDSGFAVDAMGGQPGIYSARYAMNAQGERDFAHAMDKITAALEGQSNHKASFVCVLALAWPDGHVEVVRADVTGTVTAAPQGAEGFGYDPIFQPDGHDRTFAQMSREEKSAISHRAKAFAALKEKCFAS